MIDKLDLRLPRVTEFRQEPREFILESRHFESSTRTMPSGRYAWVTDFRPIGFDAILHFGLKREEDDPHEGEHKLSLLDTGMKSYSDLASLVEGIVEGPIDDLDLMRIDLCADMHGIPIDWFLGRLRVKYKRIAHEHGQLKYQRVGKAGIQTLAAGKRPNIVRVYDKVAEYENQLRKLNRNRSSDADELTLEGEFGVMKGAVITRVERQFGGGRIPLQIDSFGRLPSLPYFNPFTNIEIISGSGATMPTISQCGLDTWLTGTRLRDCQNEMGEQQFRRWLNKNSSGNAARYRKKYAEFLEPDGDNLVTAQTVFETYRESVIQQLAA